MRGTVNPRTEEAFHGRNNPHEEQQKCWSIAASKTSNWSKCPDEKWGKGCFENVAEVEMEMLRGSSRRGPATSSWVWRLPYSALKLRAPGFREKTTSPSALKLRAPGVLVKKRATDVAYCCD